MDKSMEKQVEEQIAKQTHDMLIKMDELFLRLDAFDKRIDSGFADVNERLDRIDRKLDSICGQVETFSSHLIE